MPTKAEIQKIFSQYTAAEMRKMIMECTTQKELAKQLGVSEHILRGYAGSLGIVRKQGRPVKTFKFKEQPELIED